MWRRPRNRKRHPQRVRASWGPDSSNEFESRWYDERGRPTGHVRVVDWDERFDAPDRVAFLVEGHGVILQLRAGRIKIHETQKQRRSIRLNLPIESCVSANVQERRTSDGSVVLRFDLRAKIGASWPEPMSVSLLFPAECRPQLSHLVDQLHESDRVEPVGPAAAQVSEPPPPANEVPPGRVDEERKSPTFRQLSVVGVPDTEEWLSFHPLPSSADVFAFKPPRGTGRR